MQEVNFEDLILIGVPLPGFVVLRVVMVGLLTHSKSADHVSGHDKVAMILTFNFSNNRVHGPE